MLHFGFRLVDQDKEERYKHDTKYNGKYHSEEDTRTDGLTACRTRSACQYHRKHTQHKSKGSHQDRPKTELGSMDGRLYQVSSLVDLHLSKLHNQNGILCRKPHQHHQANLEINIILQSAYHNAQIGTQSGYRQRKQYSDRYRPAFILRSQKEEYEKEHQRKHKARLSSRLFS